MKSKVLVCIVLVTMLGLSLLAGCNSPRQAEAGYYERLTDVVSESVDAQQTATRQIVMAIEQSRILPAEKLSKIEGQLDKVDKYVDMAQVAAKEAAKVYEEKRAESQAVATIGAMRAANTASAPVNPYAPLIDVVLGVATVIAGGYGVTKRKELTTVAKKYEAHKRGVEAVMRNSEPTKAQELYDTIGNERKAMGI